MKCIWCGNVWESEEDPTVCPKCGRDETPHTPAEKDWADGIRAEDEQRYDDALACYVRASDGGIAPAGLAVCRILEKSGERRSNVELYEFWLAVAARTDAQAAYRFAAYLQKKGASREALWQLRNAADMGHRRANLRIALYYLRHGNRFAARYYLKRASDTDVLARCLLFVLGKNRASYPPEAAALPDRTVENYSSAVYADGLGLSQIAKYYYAAAAENHYLPAIERLSELCLSDKPGERDEAGAVRYLTELGEAGQTGAYIRLGDCYKNGFIGGVPDRARAYDMYLRAAKAGDSSAMVMVADWCNAGAGTERDPLAALAWYDQAAAAGNPLGASRAQHTREEGNAYCIRATEAMEAGDEETAIGLYHTAAEMGNATAASALGDCYLVGRAVKQSYRDAAKWYECAIALGSVNAKYRLGVLYAMNLGVRFDARRALSLFEEAVAGGCAPAKAEIAKLKARQRAFRAQKVYAIACTVYRRGDHSGAISLLVVAAKMGSGRAAYMLGCMFDSGDGMARDKARAAAYFERARELGYDGDGNRYMGKFLKNLKNS